MNGLNKNTDWSVVFMGKVIDYTGLICNNWTVIRKVNKDESTKIKGTVWIVKCNKCGFEKEVSPKQIKKHFNKIICNKCGNRDLIGQIFGLWKIIGFSNKRNSRAKMWLCECQCEDKTIKEVREYSLLNGKSISCGCEKRKLKDDISGNRYGKLLVIKRIENHPTNGVQYYTRCDCGREKVISRTAIIYHGQTSCGICEKVEDLTGHIFNRLTVIKRIENKWDNACWLTQCICGNFVEVTTTYLKNGHTKSCGCLQREYALSFENMEGKVFGRWTIIKDYRDDNSLRHTIAECECGTIKEINITNLKSGDSTSCGCYRDEKTKQRCGRNHSGWNGTSELRKFLRDKIKNWKKKSLEHFNYKCVICDNSNSLRVHHLYPYYKLIKDTLNNLNLPIYNKIDEYTDEELNLIEDKFLELHYNYGFGVPITNELHNEFHKIYGRKDFTPENFQEFYYLKTGKDFNLELLKECD